MDLTTTLLQPLVPKAESQSWLASGWQGTGQTQLLQRVLPR
jgi:hypothetical protein